MSDTSTSLPGEQTPNGEQTGASGEAGKPNGEQTGEQTDTLTVEALTAEVEEWKGHSRKWEDRAKENKTAAAERDEARQELATVTTERDEAVARADKAEAAVVRLEAAIEFGLTPEDVEALEAVSDPDAVRSLAERLSARGPRPNPAQGNRGRSPVSSSPSDLFVDAVGALF